jgi:hypothetical protein
MALPMDTDQDAIEKVPALPEREPADHEVAAGAIAGLVAGAGMAVVAAASSDQGALFPLRLVAASFLGHEALDPGWVAPVLLGTLLGALAAVVLALVFASILPRGRSVAVSLAYGLAYGAAAWAVTWYVLVRLVDPVLFAAGSPGPVLLLHLLYGAVLGLLLPPLRRVLP